jgi:hypothetical protein
MARDAAATTVISENEISGIISNLARAAAGRRQCR